MPTYPKSCCGDGWLPPTYTHTCWCRAIARSRSIAGSARPVRWATDVASTTNSDDKNKSTSAATTKTPKKTWSQKNIIKKKDDGETKGEKPGRRRRGSSNGDKILSVGKDQNNVAWSEKFEDMTKLTIVEQAEAFLMQFVMEFQGRFSEVTDLALSFQSFAGPKGKTDSAQELDEFQCHQFLEKRGTFFF